jgi:hypothetical protein
VPAVLDTQDSTFWIEKPAGTGTKYGMAPYLKIKNGKAEGLQPGPQTAVAIKAAGLTAPATVTPVAPPAPIVGTDLPPLAPEVNPTDQRLANNTQTTPAASAPEFSPAASDAAFNAARARMAEPQADSGAKVSTPAAVTVDPLDGPTGQALARMGISKKDRLNQAFVDSRLGTGKYKAGSAESNLALLKTKPAVDTIDVPKRFDKAPANVPDSTGKYFNVPSNPTPRPMNVRPLPGQPPTKNESVTYADDQTLARIVSLGRR